MSRLRFALVIVFTVLAASLYVRLPSVLNARTTLAVPTPQVAVAGPAQVSAQAPDPTPVSSDTIPPPGQRTQQVIFILGIAVLSALLIGGGIYLRRRWIATRY
jgi:hypothetical protein